MKLLTFYSQENAIRSSSDQAIITICKWYYGKLPDNLYPYLLQNDSLQIWRLVSDRKFTLTQKQLVARLEGYRLGSASTAG